MIKIMEKCGIIPVVKIAEVEKSDKLVEALQKGGINCAEITFRAERAECAIDRMLNRYPDMIVGAGTVLTVKEAKLAADAGAKFIVSPGLDEEVIQYVLERDILPVPGCISPTELQRAMKLGLRIVKFFPAEAFGGIKTIKALTAPFQGIRFMPTGGISLENLTDYMKEKAVLACGGTFMVKERFIQNAEWDTITALSQDAVNIVKNIRK